MTKRILLLIAFLAGAAWAQCGVGSFCWFPVQPPNFASGWTWLNQGGASWAPAYGVPVVYVPDSGSSTIVFRSLLETLPAPPYTITLTFSENASQYYSSWGVGLMLYDGSAKCMNFVLKWTTSAAAALQLNEESSCTTIGTETSLYNLAPTNGQITSLRIHDDGTSRTFLFSGDGGNSFTPNVLASPQSNTTFITASQAGLTIWCSTGSGGIPSLTVSVYKLTVTTP